MQIKYHNRMENTVCTVLQASIKQEVDEFVDVERPCSNSIESAADVWSEEEELKLLEAMEICGPDNWEGIASELKSRLPDQCKEYYINNFIINPKCNELVEIIRQSEKIFENHCIKSCSWLQTSVKSESGNLSLVKAEFQSNLEFDCKSNAQIDTVSTELKEEVVDFIDSDFYSLESSQSKSDSPGCSKCLRSNEENKFLEEKINCCCEKVVNFLDSDKKYFDEIKKLSKVTGYNALRDEFEIEYDDKAERILTLLNSDSLVENDELYKELTLSVMNGYNFRLAERLRRKRLVHQFGLLNQMKIFSWYNKFKNVLGEKLMKSAIRFLHLVSREEFDNLLTRLVKVRELQSRCNKLISYRLQGIRRRSGISLFESLKKTREEGKKKLNSITSISLYSGSIPAVLSVRRIAAPLNIFNMPGFAELDEEESNFCSVNRIIPINFTEYKEILVNECKKKNGIKLAQARSLFKIDVNKTRKIYNFLTERNLIWTSPIT